MMEPTPRDDIESIGYILIYFYLGKLTWDLPNITNEQMFYMKSIFVKEEKQKEIIPSVLLKFLSFVQEQESNEIPKYDKLYSLLENK